MAKKAVILDIDGTLSPEVSWTALTRDLGGSVEHHLSIYQDFRAGRLSSASARRQLIGMWSQNVRPARSSLGEIFDQWPLDPDARPLVRDLQGRGYTICLITGSFDLYAAHVARRLGVAHYFANSKLIFSSNGELVDFGYSLDQAAIKLGHFERFCLAQGLQPTDCYAVGNGSNDIGLFRRTGHGILIERPDQPAELKVAAEHVVARLGQVARLIQ